MQSTLFGEEVVPVASGIVNVASVPQRSPFRYPGGKTWLVPRLRQWLDSQPAKPREFIEPFAGGGIASLTTAFESRAKWVTMVERDEQVAAVWRVMLQQPGGGQWLADRIMNFDLTPESVREVLCPPAPSLREIAFRTLLKNRINHGGILGAWFSAISWFPSSVCRRGVGKRCTIWLSWFCSMTAFEVRS